MPGRYSRRLERMGLSNSNGVWSVKDPSNWRRIRRFCKNHGLTYVEAKDRYVRSGSYRGVFFTHERETGETERSITAPIAEGV